LRHNGLIFEGWASFVALKAIFISLGAFAEIDDPWMFAVLGVPEKLELESVARIACHTRVPPAISGSPYV
jgi:hypothetical protein